MKPAGEKLCEFVFRPYSAAFFVCLDMLLRRYKSPFPAVPGKGQNEMVFLVKRDPGRPAGDGNWIRMNASQFRSFLKTPDGQIRKKGFGIVDPCGGDALIVIETDGNRACELKKQHNRNCYVNKNLRSALERHGMHIISFEEDQTPCSGSGSTFVPVDAPLSVEETAERNMELEMLRKAYGRLGIEERTLIRCCVLGEETVTESMYGEIRGMSREEVHARKRKILRKLKKEMEKATA